MRLMMQVAEIFSSIEGEGRYAGELAVFIRLCGCNLRCSYCDTPYALTDDGSWDDLNPEDIVSRVRSFGCERVTLTGGEPLRTDEGSMLAQRLTDAGFWVNIETNGTVYLGELAKNPRITLSPDYKLPSSGCGNSFDSRNFDCLRENDILKFVMAEEDEAEVRRILMSRKLRCGVYLSPVFGRIEPSEIVRFMQSLLQDGISMRGIRLQLQLHKYIWDPDRRGV
ncbi:MAG: radical SAM protein [Desulfovibrionaceae bacterium]|nr:radical SAM protein [Desulfovibrionaceae bacterium]